MISPKLIIDRLLVMKIKFKSDINFHEIKNIRMKDVVGRIIDDLFELDHHLYNQSLKKAINSLSFECGSINDGNFSEMLNKALNLRIYNKVVISKIEYISGINSKIAQKKLLKIYENSVNRFSYKIYFSKYNFKRICKEVERINAVKNIYSKLKSFDFILNNGWSKSVDYLMNQNIDEIEKIQESINSFQFIEMIADFLGRLTKSQNEFSLQNVEVLKNNYTSKFKDLSPENISGVKYGNNISIILPHQIAMRNNKNLKKLFNLNFIENKLVELKQESNSLDEIYTNEIKLQPKLDKGPFIICIDTSASMYGIPEKFAKAFVVHLVNIALKENRKCFLISFSVNVKVLEISDVVNNYEKFIKFITSSFWGGTDITEAINVVTEMIMKEDYKKSDVIFISDMLFGVYDNRIINKVNLAKEKGVRFMGLTIDPDKAISLHEKHFFDHHWVFQNDQKSIDAIIKSLNDRKD